MLGRRESLRPKPYSLTPLGGRLVGRGSLLLVLIALVAGCGSKTDDAAQKRAAEIENRAMQAENEAARLDREREQKEKIAAAQKATTVTVPSDSLPAGSEEIDGPQNSSGGGASLISAADRASFKRLAADLPGDEGVAITTLAGTPVVKLGSVDGGVAWSTGKVPVTMAAIAAGTAKDSDLRPAITASDNAAAERLWSGLGGGAKAADAATAQLRAAGDTATVIEPNRIRGGYTAFGQTAWKLTDQARFVAGMACTDEGSRLLELMGEVSSGQRWGLGDTGLPARFKGGWGPGVTPGSGDGWLERQMGILTIKGKPIVVTIASTGPGHEADTITLSRIAKWVAEHVDSSGAPMQPSC